MEVVLSGEVDCRRRRREASSANLASRMWWEGVVRVMVVKEEREEGRVVMRGEWERWERVMEGEGEEVVGRAMCVVIVVLSGCGGWGLVNRGLNGWVVWGVGKGDVPRRPCACRAEGRCRLLRGRRRCPC